jgi:hypothetical protein
MKQRYIDLMEKALSAYSLAHIERYFNDVKKDGLTEHGFPRLTSNIGIMIAHGRRRDLMSLFLEMMDFCCHQIPRVKAANDFSVREILNCIKELEDAKAVDAEHLDAWKREIATIEPYSCYTKIAKSADEEHFNWALFTAVSEYRRMVAGLGGDRDVIDTQIATQLRHLDENGMYRDGNTQAPIVYDHVPRGLFAILLRLGYDGKYHDRIDEVVKNGALLSLKMQSVTGEMPFGGRSNQFIHNEAWLALIFEYEARRYASEGDLALAGKFKAAANRAVDVAEHWLSKAPIYHIKNRYPTESKYGCETYAYFDKYMITAASFLHEAYLNCDDRIAATEFDVATPVAWQTSEYFHAVYLRAGGYSAQLDIAADPHYDASGLGRVHRAGAPSAICMSVPCPGGEPNYTVETATPRAFSLCAGVKDGDEWCFATGKETAYEVVALTQSDGCAKAEIVCCFESGKTVKSAYTVSENGVCVAVCGEGEIAFSLPAFEFDGETHTEITADEHTLQIRYEGWVCRYVTDGRIIDLNSVAENRNGRYRAFSAIGKEHLGVHIEILKEA